METVEIKIEDLKLTVKGELEEYCPGDRTTPPAGGNFYAHEVLTASGEDIIDLLSKRVLDKIKQSCFDELLKLERERLELNIELLIRQTKQL